MNGIELFASSVCVLIIGVILGRLSKREKPLDEGVYLIRHGSDGWKLR